MSYRTAFLGLLLALPLVGFSWVAHAQAETSSLSGAGTISRPGSSSSFFSLLEERIEVNTYIRVSGLRADDFEAPGRKLTEWADFQLTMFDPSYIEPTIRYRHGQKMLLVAQAGIRNRLGGATLPMTREEEETTTKELYAELYGVGGGENSIWAGRRKFRVVDEHDIIGGGYRFKVSEELKAGLTYGMRRDFGYWGMELAGEFISPEFETPFRRLLAVDFERSFGDNANLQLLLEYQRMDGTVARFRGADGMEKVYDLESLGGFVLGVEGNRWSQDWNISTAFTYSYGDVGGSPFAKFNTRGSAAEVLDVVGNSPMTVHHLKKDNQRLTLTHYGAGRVEKASYTFLVANSYDAFRDGNARMMNLLQAKPFYHLTRKVHLGTDLSRTTMIRGYSQPSTTVVAPTLKYAFRPEVGYTGNQIQVFYATAIYDHEYDVYGEPRKFAGTLGAQLEAYF